MPRIIPVTKNGLTALWIIQSAGDVLKQRARYVKIDNIRRRNPNKFGFTTYTCRATSLRNNDGTVRSDAEKVSYKIRIQVINKKHHLVVDCECGAHLYWGAEYSLTQRKAAEIKRGNGAAPDIRRPDWRTNASACKHVTAALSKILNRPL